MHIDEWIDTHQSSDIGVLYAKYVFSIFRLPALDRARVTGILGDIPLFCSYEKQRYRCTGASRLGDVWLTADFKQSVGYQKRVNVEECSDWGPRPESILWFRRL